MHKTLSEYQVVTTLFYTGDVQLGSSKEVVVAWWGSFAHPLCRISDINTIIVNPEDGETMICSQATGWMEYIINLYKETPVVADMFSSYGMEEYNYLIFQLLLSLLL